MKNIFFAALFLVSASLYSCEGDNKAEEQQEQVETESQDSMRNSVLEEADKALQQGDTTMMPQDSAGISH